MAERAAQRTEQRAMRHHQHRAGQGGRAVDGGDRAIVQALEGSIALTNQVQGHKVTGLDAVVRLPLPAPLTDSALAMQAAQSHP